MGKGIRLVENNYEDADTLCAKLEKGKIVFRSSAMGSHSVTLSKKQAKRLGKFLIDNSLEEGWSLVFSKLDE